MRTVAKYIKRYLTIMRTEAKTYAMRVSRYAYRG